MATENNYGKLLTPDIKLHRIWFKQMVDLIGIKVLYMSPKADKQYTNYTEIKSSHNDPEVIGCIFEEHPEQQTLRKIGWVSELQEGASIIHVEYDLAGLQQGAFFIIPSGIDNAEGRLFRVTKLKNGIIYPASMTCELVPEYENTFEESQYDYKNSSFNLLNDGENE